MYNAIIIDKWTSVKLDENAKYGISLMEGRDKDGVFLVSFCKREFGKMGEKVEKNVPMNIKLGNKDHAIKVLEALLWQLKDDNAPF